MKVQFKHSRAIDQKTYAPGVHSLDDGLAQHWYLKHLIKDGDAVVVEQPAKSEPIEILAPVESSVPNLSAEDWEKVEAEEDDSLVDPELTDEPSDVPSPDNHKPGKKKKKAKH